MIYTQKTLDNIISDTKTNMQNGLQQINWA